jgi:hypothetical protein
LGDVGGRGRVGDVRDDSALRAAVAMVVREREVGTVLVAERTWSVVRAAVVHPLAPTALAAPVASSSLAIGLGVAVVVGAVTVVIRTSVAVVGGIVVVVAVVVIVTVVVPTCLFARGVVSPPVSCVVLA